MGGSTNIAIAIAIAIAYRMAQANKCFGKVCLEDVTGPNLETSGDSTGNGLANFLVELEHMDDKGKNRDKLASCGVLERCLQ